MAFNFIFIELVVEAIVDVVDFIETLLDSTFFKFDILWWCSVWLLVSEEESLSTRRRIVVPFYIDFYLNIDVYELVSFNQVSHNRNCEITTNQLHVQIQTNLTSIYHNLNNTISAFFIVFFDD